MALPVLNTATFEVIVPSTNKPIRCRPFLVKEEKILLMALESKSEEESINAIKQILNNCIIDWKSHNLEGLAIFDLEYIFLKLRAKAKGEKISIKFKGIETSECEECRKPKVVQIDLNKIEIKRDVAHSKKIQLTDEVGVTMHYPKFSLLGKYDLKNSSEVKMIFELIKSCLESIYDADATVHLIKECTEEEVDAFIESLSGEQFEKLFNFFTTMPKIEYALDLSCDKCGRKDVQNLTGLQSFFR